ncbi:Ig-like domain-containing protein [Segniliparus rugosus]|uniref:Ig-like domain-containing protein n=1 Tax=Segniliparus rugosus TaxID=286804 RepID=UPI0012EC509B|nr:Ig-like domain-containing protein [Segniliparus rugosus]
MTGTGTNWIDVPNFGAGDPDTVVSGSPPAVVVQGSKTGATVTVRANVSGGSVPDSRVRILVNGSVVATSGSNSSSFSYSWTGNLSDESTVRFQYYGEGAFFVRPTLQNTSYMTVA